MQNNYKKERKKESAPLKLVYATAGSSTDTHGPDSPSFKCVSGFFHKPDKDYQ